MAGGGTAGHLQPALAIAEALVDAGHPGTASSSSGRPTGRTGPPWRAGGFPFTLLPGRGIVRSLAPRDSGRQPRRRWPALVGGARCAASGWSLRARPRVVVSVGGYASLPASLACGGPRCAPGPGQRGRRPRCGQPAVRAVRPGQRGGVGGDPPAPAVVTGTPVRAEIAGVRRGATDAERPGGRCSGCRRTGPTVAAFGGSLGARHLNRVVDELAVRWKDRDDRSIYHIVGRRDWDEFAEPAHGATPGGGAGLCRGPRPLRGPDGRRLRRRRRRGVPGRGHDRGRAGRGRRPLGARAPPRRPGGPPDGQRPGAGTGRRRGGAGRPVRSTPAAWGTLWTASWPTRTAWTPWGGPPRRWDGATPPPPAPGWSRPTPGPSTGRGPRRRGRSAGPAPAGPTRPASAPCTWWGSAAPA